MPKLFVSILHRINAAHRCGLGLIFGICGLFWPLNLWAQQDCPPAADMAYELIGHHGRSELAFTQGLVFVKGQLAESTGLYGRSQLRLHKSSGMERLDLPANRFAEGLAWFEQHLWQLSWRAGEVRVYSLQPLKLKKILRYQGEGWGLTHDGQQFIMSDGSPTLSFRSDQDFSLIGHVVVREQQMPVANLNELEWVEGRLFANIWQQDRIASIDPKSGCVMAWLDLRSLWPRMIRPAQADVLNGIAWNPQKRELWVTGKNWPRMYRLKLPALKRKK